MDTRLVYGAVTALFAAAFSFLPVVAAQTTEDEPEEPELAIAMSQLQYFTHKLALSIEARNADAARFYLHEVEEVGESIRDEIPEYEGFEIGPLVGSMLMPNVERLEEALLQPEWPAADEALRLAVASCNACHQATDHGFIVIEHVPGSNPYMQSFRPVTN